MEYMRFADVAQAQGLPLKLAYKASEVSKVLGIAVSTLDDEIKAGRLHSFLPEGRRCGRLIRPEHVDQWMLEGER